MCIFNAPVKSVNATRIFVCSDGSRQLTVYGNKVVLHSRQEHNAMILPVPGPASDLVLDLRLNSKEAREDVERLFTMAQAPFEIRSRSYTNTNAAKSIARGTDFLEVKQVGSYKVSVASSTDDLARFDTTIFRVDPSILNVLRERYRAGFGFLICQLDDSKPYHPFAYLHNVAVTSNGNAQLFIPTLHIHGQKRGHGSIMGSTRMRRTLQLEKPTSSASESGTSKPAQLEEVSRDWDHAIYAVSSSRHGFAANLWDAHQQARSLSPLLALDDMQVDEARLSTDEMGQLLNRHLPTTAQGNGMVRAVFAQDSWAPILKISCRGMAPNGDLLLALSSNPQTASPPNYPPTGYPPAPPGTGYPPGPPAPPRSYPPGPPGSPGMGYPPRPGSPSTSYPPGPLPNYPPSTSYPPGPPNYPPSTSYPPGSPNYPPSSPSYPPSTGYPSNPGPPTSMYPPPSTANSMHSGLYCNCCRVSPIAGVKYRCLICPDFDVCESCVRNSRHLSPATFRDLKRHKTSHILARIEPPAQLQLQLNKSRTDSVHNVSCTRCNLPIVGARYTCAKCNVHLCSECDQSSEHWSHGVARFV